jgi:hypothetical protein
MDAAVDGPTRCQESAVPAPDHAWADRKARDERNSQRPPTPRYACATLRRTVDEDIRANRAP